MKNKTLKKVEVTETLQGPDLTVTGTQNSNLKAAYSSQDLINIKRILVIVSDKLLSTHFFNTLSAAGHHAAASCYKGLRLFDKEEFDLILYDICIPGIDSRILACLIKAKSPQSTF